MEMMFSFPLSYTIYLAGKGGGVGDVLLLLESTARDRIYHEY